MPRINGQVVGPIGFGLMGFTWRAEPAPVEQAIEAMHTALQSGMNFWNGGEFYGTPQYNSGHLLEKYFEKYPEDADKVVISIKGAVGLDAHSPSGKPEELDRSIGTVIKLLNGRKKLDVFECARRDPNTPLDVTFSHMQKEYIDKGLLGGISLSEVSAATIHEAVKVAKIVAVEVELSLWATDVLNNGVAAACAQYNIPLVAYSPLGRGILTGQIKSLDDLPANSMLRRFPRYQPEHFHINLELVAEVEKLATKKGVTPAQLAISWCVNLARRPGMPTIIPIPGATTAQRVLENSVIVDLSEEELDEIDAILAKVPVSGGRYPEGAPIEG